MTHFALTENETKALVVLVSECLIGIGGARPSDLENREFTWTDAGALRFHGWDRREADEVFAALLEKGVVEPGPGEFVIKTEAWRCCDTIWDQHTDVAKGVFG